MSFFLTPCLVTKGKFGKRSDAVPYHWSQLEFSDLFLSHSLADFLLLSLKPKRIQLQSMRSMILCWSSLITFHHCLQCFEEILTSHIGLEQNRSSKQAPWAKCTVPVPIGEARSCVRLASSRDEMAGQIFFCGWSIHLAKKHLVRILPK